MNTEIANALFGYLKTLYDLNRNLIRLCGIDIMNDFDNSDKKVLDIIQDIPRIIPYSANRKTLLLELNQRNGLLEYDKEISYLKSDYESILKKNYDFLDKIRKIRNKYEHKMHGIKHQSSGSGSMSLFDFEFDVEGESIKIYSGSFIELFKSLNELFSKIVLDIKKYASENGKEEYSYYRRITRFDFLDFNKIYENELLRTIGILSKEF